MHSSRLVWLDNVEYQHLNFAFLTSKTYDTAFYWDVFLIKQSLGFFSSQLSTHDTANFLHHLHFRTSIDDIVTTYRV